MSKIALAVIALSLIGIEPSTKPPITCEYMREVDRLALIRLKTLEKMFEMMEPYSPPREVIGAEIDGVIELLNQTEAFKKKNCKEA